MLIQWHITQDIEEIDGFNLIATKSSLYPLYNEERKMSEFNTLTERELANVSGGGGGGIAFTIASEIPDFIKGIQKGYSKAKKRNKRRKNIN